jgi:glycosyltransferase involved in cell wall biosynthesis
MRLAVFADYPYRIDDDVVYAELPFARFVEGLWPHCERLVVVGRLDPSPGRYPFRLEHAELVPLPHYESGAQLWSVLRTVPAGARRFWRLLDEVDSVLVDGPSPPQALIFAVLTKLRRRRLALSVRQDLPAHIRHRHPGRPAVRLAANVLELGFRALARFVPVVAVGPDLARRYRHSRALLQSYVSLVGERDLLAPGDDGRRYDGRRLRMLSVGRLDPEKNPLLLAEVLARAVREDPRWHLDVCGAGTMEQALAGRLAELGVAGSATLHGYVPIDGGLLELYRQSHVLLHVSRTEGLPQVLLEAFASRLPVVATDVGGVGEVVAGRGILIPPEDPEAAAAAVRRIAARPGLRTELVERAYRTACEHTLERECARLAAFLDGRSAP